MKRKITVVGIVLAVDAPDVLHDPIEDPLWDPCIAIDQEFSAAGYDVQAVSLHIDGQFRVEVLA